MFYQNSFDTLETRPLARLSYRLCGPVALITNRIETTLEIGNHALIPFVTPRDRALCRFRQFRQNPHNNRFQVVIYDNITTVHEYSATTTEEIYTTRLSESRIQLIQYKDPDNSGRQNSVRLRTRYKLD